MDIISKLEGLVQGHPFIGDDFMLTNEFARELYHESAEKMPIIDYHCHLVPRNAYRLTKFPFISTSRVFPQNPLQPPRRGYQERKAA